MSVLIKGMETPKSCYDCPLAMQDYTTLFGNNFKQTRNSYACVLTHKVITSTKRNRFCPLIPVPVHGRLIDADEISKNKYATIPPYRKEYSDGKPKSEDEVIAFKFGWNDAIDAIVASAQTIIEAEEE